MFNDTVERYELFRIWTPAQIRKNDTVTGMEWYSAIWAQVQNENLKTDERFHTLTSIVDIFGR